MWDARLIPSGQRVLVLALFLGLAVGCSAAAQSIPEPPTRPIPPGGRASLTVSAASSLTAVFKDIGGAFERTHPGSKVTFNFAGSQELRTQIEQGAKVDVFASADLKNMDLLRTESLLSGDAQVFAHNVLVVIVPKVNSAGIKELKDVSKPGLKVVIADASVPVGSYTLQMLEKLSADPAYGAEFKRMVLARVVSKENNVKAIVSKVALGEADAGVVYATDATPADQLTTIPIPDAYNVTASYSIAALKASTRPSLARQFVDYVLSPEGQVTLKSYGFAPK